jgi:hypothetical protein
VGTTLRAAVVTDICILDPDHCENDRSVKTVQRAIHRLFSTTALAGPDDGTGEDV